MRIKMSRFFLDEAFSFESLKKYITGKLSKNIDIDKLKVTSTGTIQIKDKGLLALEEILEKVKNMTDEEFNELYERSTKREYGNR
jgi:hypothetical protein